MGSDKNISLNVVQSHEKRQISAIVRKKNSTAYPAVLLFFGLAGTECKRPALSHANHLHILAYWHQFLAKQVFGFFANCSVFCKLCACLFHRLQICLHPCDRLF